jgi:hypothetical protein
MNDDEVAGKQKFHIIETRYSGRVWHHALIFTIEQERDHLTS